jgi:hypothetical protein
LTTTAANLRTHIGTFSTTTNAYYYGNEPSSYAIGWKTHVLAATGVADMQAALPQNWFAVGILERDGTDTYYIVFDGWNETNIPYLEIDYFVPEFGVLNGTVTENTGGAPMQGVTITATGPYNTYTMQTLADGTYEFDPVQVGTYTVTAEMTGYNVLSVAGIAITSGGTATQNFAMTSPTMDITPTSIDVVIDPNTQTVEYIDIDNNGDGSLDWDAQLEMLTEATEDAWDIQFQIDVTATSGAAGNAGAECDGQYYYSTRWATNLIHKFNLDGTLAEEFSIPGVTGLRDLAYDGEHMFGGAAATTIFEMDFVNKTLIGTIISPQQVRSIAYDDGEDAFWCANWATDITLVSKTGTALNTFPATVHGLGGMYGTAYDMSTGTPVLYIFDQGSGAGTAQIIHEADLSTITMTGFSYDVLNDLASTGAIAGGLFIVDNVFPGLWSIGGLLQGTPDIFFMYELANASPLWLTINQNSGTLTPGANNDITLNFNTFDLLPGNYFATIQFASDPNVGEPAVDVTLHVIGLPPPINLELDFDCTDVLATWEMPAGGNPESWNIYRDGVLIGSSTVMSYTDEMVDTEVEYGYYVKAVYAGVESTATQIETITVTIPDDLEVDDLEGTASGYTVNLDWNEPACCVTPDSYDIYRDGVMIDNVATTQYTDPDLPQGFYEYYVKAVYYFGTSGSSNATYVLVPSVGIGELNADAFQIFPNPADELVNIKSTYQLKTVTVLNNSGQVVIEKEVDADSYQLKVSKLEGGIYYIKLKTSEGFVLRKITIE